VPSDNRIDSTIDSDIQPIKRHEVS